MTCSGSRRSAGVLLPCRGCGMVHERRPPESCTCYGRWECASCTLELLERGEREQAEQTEISKSLRALGVIREGGAS